MDSPPTGRTAQEQRDHEFARMCFDWTAKDRETRCPGSPAEFDAQGNVTEPGCRCYQHEPGVFSRVVRVNVQTVGTPTLVRCTGRLDCSCENCVGQLQASIARQRQASKRQPWEPKPSRHAERLAA